MHRKHRDQHFDGERGGEKSREQSDDETDAADGFEEHRRIGKSERRLETVLRHDVSGNRRGADLELAPDMHDENDADDNAYQRVRDIAPVAVKPGKPRIDQLCLTSCSHVSPLRWTRHMSRRHWRRQVYNTHPAVELFFCRAVAARKNHPGSVGTNSLACGTGTPSIRQRSFLIWTRPSATSLSAIG